MTHLIQLVDGDDDLAYTETAYEQQMLARLAPAVEPSLKFTDGGVDDEQRRVSLRRPRNHVRDEVTMAWRIEDCDDSVWGVQSL